jgi:two-component system, OmpR family, alkaline phosphatase synthesis response regulator PhoP
MSSILVIEDDTEILENIEEILSDQNFQTLATSDSLVGLQLAKEESPDLVLCDVMMPQLDGYGVLSHLRQHEGTATLPFIFLTGRSDRADLRLGMELGADDYLTKPFTNEELVRAIEICLNKRTKIANQYESKQQEMESLQKKLQLAQELTEMNALLLHQLSQGLRHPISNVTIATYMLKQGLSGVDCDRYVAILEEECARGTSLLNEVATLQEYLNPSKINLLRGKLKVRVPLS